MIFILSYFRVNNAFTVSDYIINRLNKYKIKHIFGYPGGANLQFFEKLNKNSNISVVISRHEQWSGHIAEGLSKFNQKLGVVIATSGPGLTNLITPLQDSLSDGVPLLCISGQVSTKVLGTDAFQECKATSLTKACTKKNYLITKPEQIISVMDEAINLALTPRYGPVHIDICSDLFNKTINVINMYPNLINTIRPISIKSNKLSNKKLNYVTNLINNSEKPVLILGQGSYNAKNELRKFVDDKKIPVTTTLHGLGIIDEHNSMSLKMHGMHGTAYANYAIQDSDLIIGIGNRFDDRTTGLLSKYAPNCDKIIYVDNDNNRLKQIKKHLPHKVITVNSDSKSFIKLIDKKVNDRVRYNWINKIMDLKMKYPLRKESGMAASQVILELSKLLEYRKNFTISTGVGNHQMKLAQYMTWTEPKQMISSGSQGTMGVALPFAIGAYYNNPNNDIFCFDGDGSFMMSAVELATIKEYNIPIKIIIINDKSLQMVNMWQEIYYDKCKLGNSPKNPSFKKMAKGFGIKSISCSSPLTIKRALKKVINSKEPILCEFLIDKSWCTPFVGPGKALDEMIL